MEVIMSSPVNECLGMENDISNAVVKLTNAQKKNTRRKLKKKMKANQEDTENHKSKPEVHLNTISPSSLQDNPDTGLHRSAIVEQKMTVSSPAAPGVEKSSVLGIENDNGNGAVKLNKSRKKNRRRAVKRKVNANQEDTEKSSVSKSEDHAKVANGEMGSSATTNLNAEVKVQNKMETAIGETGSGTNTTDNTTPKKRKRRRQRNKNPGSSEILSTHESTQHTVLAKNDSSATINVNVKGMAEEQSKMETAIGETGSGTNATVNTTSKRRKRKRSKDKNPGSSDILSTHESTQGKVIATNDSSATRNVNVIGMAEEQNKMETAVGETGSGTNATDNTTSKTRKRKKLKNTNSALGDILSTHESTKNENPGSSDILSTHESTQGKVIATNDSSATRNVNVIGMAEEQNKMETAVGETGSGTNATDNTTSKTRKRKKLKNTNSALGDILSTHESTKNENPGSSDILSTHESTQGKVIAMDDSSATRIVNVIGMAEEQNKMETTVGETGSGTNATDNTTSKTLKRKKLKNTNPALGDILSTHESTKNENPGSSDILSTHESTQGKVIATNDSSATRNVNVIGMAEEQNKMEMTVGETGSGTNATDNTASKTRKRKKLKNKNPASGDILSTRESTEDMAIAKKESSTTNVLEAMSGQMVSQGEEHMQAAIGKMGSGAIKNLDANDAGKMENKLKSKKRRPTLGEILNPQYLESLEAADSVENINSTIERKAKADQALMRNFWWQREKNQYKGIKEVFQAATLGKKLIILDVNGLLADLVSPRPKDVIADFYVPRKAIFKRPFLEDFLCFCFERFNVGIWSSRTKDNLDLAVHFLLGDLKEKLLFLWDATKCTNTYVRTLEDKYKYIVLKDLRMIWEEDAEDNRWVKGTFDESNTLLFDDSPYKALMNPKHSGIFPTSYCYKNRDDNFLGPNGEFRTYLEGLAACDNVQTYVQQHPFGQRAIDEEDPNWGFYKRLIRGQSRTIRVTKGQNHMNRKHYNQS